MPMNASFKAKLDTAGTILLIVACFAVLGDLVVRRLAPRTEPKGLQVGDTITSLEVLGESTGANSKALMIALNSSCRYCTESLPFYRRLFRDVRGLNHVRLVGVTRETEQQGRDYLERAGISIPVMGDVDFSKLGVRGTPMLILADRGGTVLKVWYGKLTPPEEDSVLLSLVE